MLYEIAEFMIDASIEAIRQWPDKGRGRLWTVAIRNEYGVVRSKPKKDVADAFEEAQAASELKKDAFSGKAALADLAHRGIVSLDDVNWLVGRFDEEGRFRER